MDGSLSFESFFAGAKKAAHRGMVEHGRREYDDFALFAGVAIEKLAKAVLISRNPAYLVEMRNGNSDMLLYFGGDLQMDMKNVRTIGGKDAIARLRRLGVLQTDPDLDTLIEMRNGAAHASIGGGEAKGMISPFARTIEELLDHLGQEPGNFWERWATAVVAAVGWHVDQVSRDIQLRIEHSRHAFDDRFIGLPEGVKQEALKSQNPLTESLRAHPLVTKRSDVSYITTTGGHCPACTGPAFLAFELIHRIEGKATYVSDAFFCFICNFHAQGPEEMAAMRNLVFSGVTLKPPAVDEEDGPETD
ncbi:hypothetical protein ACFW9X_00155 [Streptomyces sp. NPDC059466]|uniref:hypothetical protein n=1 Tax=Streptomyces sp. NPDC059466 TaxID=3346843 RepID=UPI0036C1AC57